MFCPLEVMLAEKFDKPIDFYKGWRIQEKSDGIRALIVREGKNTKIYGRNMTKKGRSDFTASLPEIVDFFSSHDKNFIIDVEIMSKDFLTLQTKIRTTKKFIIDEDLYITCFDIVKWGDINCLRLGSTHDERYELLEKFVTLFNSPFLKIINQYKEPLRDEEHLRDCLDDIIIKKGEGLILKHPRGLYYPGKRRRDWTKVLPYREMDVIFTAIVEGTGKYANTMGALQAFPYDKETGLIKESAGFTVGVGFDDYNRNKIWNLPASFWPCKGKIKIKEIYERSGIPRMPVFLNFSED